MSMATRKVRQLLLPFWIAIALFLAALLTVQTVAFAAALPTSTLSVPAMQIGETFDFTVTFDSSGSTGYGPFIDLIFPATGADGDDGITFNSATYLGISVPAVQLTFPMTGCVDHPYAEDTMHTPLRVCGTPGDTLVVLQLPFGSFTPGQPPVEVTVNATMSNLADLNVAQTIRSRAGFQYGSDALNNPCCDPSITNPSSIDSTTWPGASVSPFLYSLSKVYSGPEDETATGPNFPRRYRIEIDVAPGQTLTNLDVSDILPNNLVFAGVAGSSPVGATVTQQPPLNVPSNAPNNLLTVRFPSVTGTTSDVDAWVDIDVYVPLNNANAQRVINATSGDDAVVNNNAEASASWTPIDTRDPVITATANGVGVGPEHVLQAKSIAVQKSVDIANDVGMPDYSVGDTLEYTIEFQISDFFAFQNVVISDTISDGQRFDPSFTPRLSVNGNGYVSSSAPMNAANYTVTPNYTPASPAPNDGSTTFTFRVSDEMVSRGFDGTLIGGCIPEAGTGGGAPNCATYNDGPTTGTLTFRTIIQDAFSDDYPSGDPYMNSGDILNNAVTITGDLLSETDTSVALGTSESDSSATSINIVFGELSKTVYAINGSTTFSTNPINVSPGDTVTYRISYELASSDFENLKFIDNLPLPIFSATEITTFDSVFDPSGAAPAAGHYKLGPNDTYHSRPGAHTPTLTTNATDNSVAFDYGTFNDPTNQASTIDLLFTVTVGGTPFADGLFLTNQVRETDGSTNGPIHIEDAIIQIKLNEPVLQVRKGVISTDRDDATLNPPAAGPVTFTEPGSTGTRWTGTISSSGLDATPIDSDISGVDAGDLVSFAIVIENTGNSRNGAFDITITDTIPLGLTIPTGSPGLNLRVTYGDGTPITFTGLTNGAGAALDLFGAGIRLDDPAGEGVCQTYDPDNGKNIIVITYDLQVDSNAPSGTIIPNYASITNYSSVEGGPNFVPDDKPTDAANTGIASPELSKSLIGTSLNENGNSNTQAAIGELITYEVVATIPEGQTENATIVDTLDNGLAFVGVDSVTLSSGLTSSKTVGTGTSPSNTTVTSNGRIITFDFGTITNSNTDNAVAETITIRYTVVMLNVASNTSGATRNNLAQLTWEEGSTSTQSASNVTVVESDLRINKTITQNGHDAGDIVTYQLTITNTSSVTAHDVVVVDTIPTGLTYVAGSWTQTAGVAGTLSDAGAPTLQATWASLEGGQVVTLTYSATIDSNVAPGQQLVNNARATWSSLPGDPGQISTHNTNSTERTGGTGVNDYVHTDTETVTVDNITVQKSLVATSEDHTSGNNVAVGEIVRYRLVSKIPEGVAPNLIVRDQLPDGLQFINDGTARMRFISSNANGLVSSAEPGIPAIACVNFIGNASSLGTLTSSDIDCVFADENISASRTAHTDSYTSGTDVYFKVGTITNNDRDADEEYLVIEFNALVMNNASTNAGNQLNNNYFVSLNGSATQHGSVSNNVGVRIVEPSIPFNSTTNNKTVTPASGDAGDVVTYTVTFTNANGTYNTDAFDLVLSDTLPPQAILDLSSITATASACTPAPNITNQSAGNTVQFSIDRLPTNCTITVTYQATLATSVLPSQELVNTANLTYTSLPGTNGTTTNPTGSSVTNVPGNPSGERDGSGGVNDYSGSDTATVEVFAPAPVKALVSTSEAHTSGSSVAIGEIVRYRLTVQVAEGSSPNFQITDLLPSGLTYLADTARVALVSSDPGLASSTLSGAGLQVTGNESTLASITPTFALPSSAVSGGTGAAGAFQPGDDPVFSLGDLTNSDDDLDLEYVVLEFNALVNNVAGNQAGTNLDNTFTVSVYGSVITTSDVVRVTVAEPSITNLSKTITISPSDAGDEVVYEITYSNTASGANRATAFDVVVSDVLNANLELTNVAVTVPSGSTYVDASTLGVGGTVLVTVDQLPPVVDIPGAEKGVTVVVTAKVIDTANNGLIIPNTANLVYTSLPGSHGTTTNATGSSTPGTSGQPSGERDGSGGVNDYSDSDSINLTLSTPTVQKLAPTPTNYTIGEEVTYDIRVTLPEGATKAITVTDVLPTGLTYVSHSVVTTAAASNGNLTADYNGSLGTPVEVTNNGTTLSVLFENVQTNGSGPAQGSSANQFLLRVVARVENIAGNQDGTTLTNTASMSYTNVNTNTSVNVSGGSQTITVVEPSVVIDKSVTPASANVGDTVTYHITVTNTSTVTAYNVLAQDTLPTGLTYVPNSLQVVSGSAIVTDTAAPLMEWLIESLAGGAKVEVEFQAVLDGSGGNTITNQVAATWSSMPGNNPNERDGSGGVNDYSTDDDVNVQIASFVADKRLVSPVSGLVGVNDTVRFSITITNTGATTLATIPLTDTFDADKLDFVSATVAPSSVTAGQLVWTNVGPLASGATTTILVDFKALASTDDQNGKQTINRIDVSGTDGFGTDVTTTQSTASVAIGAPDLVVTKTDGVTSVTTDDLVIYTIQVTNTGTYTATGVIISETLPANTSFNAGASTAGWSPAGGGVYTFAVGTLGIGNSISVDFAVVVNSTVPAGVDTIDNTVSVTDDGTRGPDPTPANNTFTDSDVLRAAPDLQIVKDDHGIVATVGSVITYTLTYTNTGNQDATGVYITEVVPVGTTANVSDLPLWTCTPDGNVYSNCIYTVGNLAVGATGSVTFTVTVDSTLPAGLLGIENTAAITDDGSNGSDPTPADNISTVTTAVTAAPELTIVKTDANASVLAGGTVAYTLTYSNTGTRGASGVVITETVPLHTSFDASASTAGWTCTPDNGAGSTCTFAVGTVEPGDTGDVTFAVVVDSPLPAGVTLIDNTASIDHDGTNGTETDTSDNTSNDTTPVRAAPDLVITKTGDSVSTKPGATINYTLTYTNVGTIAATGVVITETVPLNTIFNAAASAPTVWSCADGSVAGTVCTTSIPGTLAGGGAGGSVKFSVDVVDTPDRSAQQIDNTTSIGDDGANGTDMTPANNTYTATIPFAPTAIALSSFTATAEGNAIVVRWVTSAEFNTWGFKLYRSTDGTRANAVLVTAQPILSTGRGGLGASYEWRDTNVQAGQSYTYWLEEIELNGVTSEHGPSSATVAPAAAGYRFFVPIVSR